MALRGYMTSEAVIILNKFVLAVTKIPHFSIYTNRILHFAWLTLLALNQVIQDCYFSQADHKYFRKTSDFGHKF